jgi:hypothetical protein
VTGAAAGFVGGSAAIALAFSSTSVSGYSNTGAAANITTGSVSVTPSGGVGSYTYLWSQYETSPYTWTIGTSTAATTNFTCTSVPAGVTAAVRFLVTVTDSTGNTARGLVTATVNNGQPYDPYGGGGGSGGGHNFGGQIP